MKLSSTEGEKIKKEFEGIKGELSKARGSLDSALKAKEDLAEELRVIVEEHSRCEVMK